MPREGMGWQPELAPRRASRAWGLLYIWFLEDPWVIPGITQG